MFVKRHTTGFVLNVKFFVKESLPLFVLVAGRPFSYITKVHINIIGRSASHWRSGGVIITDGNVRLRALREWIVIYGCVSVHSLLVHMFTIVEHYLPLRFALIR